MRGRGPREGGLTHALPTAACDRRRHSTIVNVLDILSAAPGVAFGPNAALQAAALAGVVVSALIIVLVVLPSSRRAFAAT
jgi:hypothetical protein